MELLGARASLRQPAPGCLTGNGRMGPRASRPLPWLQAPRQPSLLERARMVGAMSNVALQVAPGRRAFVEGVASREFW